MAHDFHFVLNTALKKKIINFAKNRDMGLSETVVVIFNFMKPVLEKHYLKNIKCEKPSYKLINADVDMHVYLKKRDYKYLKQIQSNLYCFSMALVLRWTLNMFFIGVKKFGFEYFEEVVNKFSRIHLKTGKKNIFFKAKKRHMFSSCHNFNKIYHIFDHKYNLLATKFT